jgi:hypothetical protein
MGRAGRTPLFRWLGYALIACLGILWPRHAAAQEDAVRAFREASARHEWPVARRLLKAAFVQSPALLSAEIDAVEYVLLDEPQLSGQGIPGKAQADTLLQLYQAAILANPAAAPAWKTRRALLAMRFPRDYPLEALSYVREAVEADPIHCPLHLYTLWLRTAAERYAQNQYPLRKFSLDGAYLDRLLYMRAITRPDEAEECDRQAQQLRHMMLTHLPGCGPLVSSYRDGIYGGVLDLESLKSYLFAHTLMPCDDRALFDAALAAAERTSPQDASLARLAAAELMRRNAAEAALARLEQAVAWEKDPAMQAGDLLFQGELLALRQDYRGARERIERAMRLQPAWGTPYFRLVDLYLDGANACTWSSFDRKALNWLLIHLCGQARALDPSYEAEATRRILLYEAGLPTADELQLRRLRPGDTWPLRCWMGTVVKVR